VKKKQSADFHFFTSHFYTTLEDNGPRAVESWTGKKAIDIFEKKLIFIPINKDLHWSLCVLVNPGAISLASKKNKETNDPLCCLLFFDSLNMHKKSKVHTHMTKWLNAEWKRLGKGSGNSYPFNENSLRIFSPAGKISHHFRSPAPIFSQKLLLYQFLLSKMVQTVEFLSVATPMRFSSCVTVASHTVTQVRVVSLRMSRRKSHLFMI
jgi:hypothetical protein